MAREQQARVFVWFPPFHLPASPPPVPLNFQRQDQRNLHHTGGFRRRHMSHVVTGRAAAACGRHLGAEALSRFGRLGGRVVSSAGPRPRARNIAPRFARTWRTVNNSPPPHRPMFSTDE